jgi:hypothetical protein
MTTPAFPGCDNFIPAELDWQIQVCREALVPTQSRAGDA